MYQRAPRIGTNTCVSQCPTTVPKAATAVAPRVKPKAQCSQMACNSAGTPTPRLSCSSRQGCDTAGRAWKSGTKAHRARAISPSQRAPGPAWRRYDSAVKRGRCMAAIGACASLQARRQRYRSHRQLDQSRQPGPARTIQRGRELCGPGRQHPVLRLVDRPDPFRSSSASTARVSRMLRQGATVCPRPSCTCLAASRRFMPSCANPPVPSSARARVRSASEAVSSFSSRYARPRMQRR